MRGSRGFTLTEVLLTIILLSLGLLALGASGLFVGGLLDRSGRAAQASNFAARRLELLRPRACDTAHHRDGTERLMQGSATLASQRWWFTSSGHGVAHVFVSTTYFTAANRTRTDTLTTAVLCR